MAASLASLKSRLQRDLFIPVVFRLAFALEDSTFDAARADPALAAAILRATQGRLESDGLVNWFDSWLEAEAAGVDVERDGAGYPVRPPAPLPHLPAKGPSLRGGALGHALDVTRRLADMTGDRTLLLGCITGGRTLLARLFGGARAAVIAEAGGAGGLSLPDQDALADAVRLSAAYAEAQIKAGISLLVMVEEERVGDGAYLSHFSGVFDHAATAGVPTLLLSRHPITEQARRAIAKAGAVMASAPGGGCGAIRTAPLSLFAGGGAVRPWIEAGRMVGEARDPQLLLSEWELPPNSMAKHVYAFRGFLLG